MGIPFTVALVGIIVISFGLFLVLGNVGGLIVGKLAFIVALGTLIGVIILRASRRDESTAAIADAPDDGSRRVLVIANEGLDDPALCDEVCRSGSEQPTEVMIVAPVAATSPMHALADDVDHELHSAQRRLDTALQTLTAAGIHAISRADVRAPMTCLLDGLREFRATEVVMLEGGERGWEDAEAFAERVRTEVGLRVTEVHTPFTATHVA